MTEEPITYKEFYNKDRGLPEPKWGPKMTEISPVFPLQCPTCGSQDMYASGSSDDPEEIFPHETVRCKHCGRIADWYEARKQTVYHPTDAPREVVRA